MQHWEKVLDIPILDIHYRELVDDFEGTQRRVPDFFDMEWDERRAHFYR